MPYIVGLHPNSPANPHSALATGAAPQDIAHLDTVPAAEAHVLHGAVVGGPDRADAFWDLRSDWVQGEPALDYAAPVLALAARALVAGAPDPWYTRLQPGSYDARRPGGLPCDAAVSAGCGGRDWRVGKIVMGALVGGAGLLVVSLVALWMVLYWRSRRVHKL